MCFAWSYKNGRTKIRRNFSQLFFAEAFIWGHPVSIPWEILHEKSSAPHDVRPTRPRHPYLQANPETLKMWYKHRLCQTYKSRHDGLKWPKLSLPAQFSPPNLTLSLSTVCQTTGWLPETRNSVNDLPQTHWTFSGSVKNSNQRSVTFITSFSYTRYTPH